MHLFTRLAALLLVALSGVPAAGADDAIAPQLDAAEARYGRLMDESRSLEAVAAAQEILALSRQRYGADSVELAGPLTQLATAQLRNGTLGDAETTYQAAIGLVEKRAGFLSPLLATPLLGLGETFVRSEQYPQATAAYERALRVNRVNEGFYNSEQVAIRDGLTEGYLGLQDLEKANFHQEAQLHVQQRKLGKDSPELIGALTKLGRWYDRSKQMQAARLVYQDAARLVEQANGEDAPTLVEPLLAIAKTYRRQALLTPDWESREYGESPGSLLALSRTMLRRALGIVDGQQPPDPAQRARILVELGDLFMIWGKQNSAADRYQEAWQALSADDRVLQVRREEYFAQPVHIMGPVPPAIFPLPTRKAPPPNPKDLEPAYVVVRLNVDRFGRVTEATIVEADPANLLEEQVALAAKNALFRPRYVEGAPVATTGLILRHEFRYAPRKLERKDAAPVEDGSKPLAQPASGDSPPG